MLKAVKRCSRIEAAGEEASGEGAACHQPIRSSRKERGPGAALVLSRSHASNYTGRMGVLDPLCSVDRLESWILCAPWTGRSPGTKHKALAAAGPFIFYFRIFFDEYIKRV